MFEFSNKLRMYNGKGARFFVTVPEDINSEIREIQLSPGYIFKPGGTIKISVRIAFIKRDTSLFWDTKNKCYMIPIKSQIRKELKIKEGDSLHLQIELI